MEQMYQNQSSAALSDALSRIAPMLRTDPASVASSASEILDAIPGQPQALYLLSAALGLMREQEAAQEFFQWMAGKRPELAAVQYEYGMLLGRLGRRKEAAERLARAVELEPNHPGALHALAGQLALKGDAVGAGGAYGDWIKLAVDELKLLDDLDGRGVEELAKAERAMRAALEVNPTDVGMRRMLGSLYIRLSRNVEARDHLSKVLELAPDFIMAREEFAIAFERSMAFREANEQLDILSDAVPGRRGYFQGHKAANLIVLGEYDAALDLFETLLSERPGDLFLWLNYGHALRTVSGRTQDAIAAFRKCLAINKGYGGAWWALADLKTYRFSSAETEAMQAQAARDDLRDTERSQIEFALGKALETQGAFGESFEHYRRGNAMIRPYVNHDAPYSTKAVKTERAFFTPEFFAARNGYGCPSPDPIFIVGLPRAGSTLIEQILSSHSLVEGTMELCDMRDAIAEVRYRHEEKPYPALLSDLDKGALKALGERYLETSRSQRRTDRPFFTDKSGGNFMHLGVIRLALPNARIIDARRHPLGCCFSCFKQIFPAGSSEFSYDLGDVALAYRDYVELMAHFDAVLPGYVHRVFYEDVVRNPESEIRRLLDFCGLPFEEGCLRYYESDRAVRTVSSEQVRKPIDTSAGEQWRRFDQWLGPAKEVLGDVLTLYPEVPRFD